MSRHAPPHPPHARPAPRAEPSMNGALHHTDLESGYTVSQAVDLTGLGEHTLRYYERAGLLEPVRRQNSSRHRRYSTTDIARLQTLACLRATGMPLDQMRRYFELAREGAGAAPQQHAMLLTQRRVLEERLTELRGHIEHLDHKIAYYSALRAGDETRAAAILDQLFHHVREGCRPMDHSRS